MSEEPNVTFSDHLFVQATVKKRKDVQFTIIEGERKASHLRRWNQWMFDTFA